MKILIFKGILAFHIFLVKPIVIFTKMLISRLNRENTRFSQYYLVLSFSSFVPQQIKISCNRLNWFCKSSCNHLLNVRRHLFCFINSTDASCSLLIAYMSGLWSPCISRNRLASRPSSPWYTNKRKSKRSRPSEAKRTRLGDKDGVSHDPSSLP